MRICFLIGLIFLVSCNSELAKLSPINYAKIRIDTTNAGTFDQMMIYALKSDGSHGFARLFTSLPIIEDEVPSGNYDFYGMSFNTMNSEKCSKASVYIGKSSNQVTLDFQEVTCGDSEFLGSDPNLNGAIIPNVTFPTTGLEFCDSVENITSGTDRCSDNLVEPLLKHKRGHAMSANISLMTFERARGKYVTGPGLSAGCMVVLPGTYLRGLSANSVPNFLPAGNGATTPFLIRFEMYAQNASCSADTPVVLDLPNGLATSSLQAKHMITPGAPATRKIFIKMGENEICQGDNLTAEFAGGGGGYDSPKLICNESHLYNIFPSTNIAADYSVRANFSYKLLKDMDLSDNPVTGSGFNPPWTTCLSAGSNFMPIGYTWNGSSCGLGSSAGMQFFGNDKTIKGMSIISANSFVGLYSFLTHAGGQASYIQNLKISDSTFIGDSYVGALAAQAQRTSFDNITFSNVTVQSTVSAFTGSVAGETLGAPINNVHGTGMIIIGQGNVGGLVGQTSRADDGTMTNIANSSIRGNITGATFVGGLVGDMGNLSAGVLSSINGSSFVGNISADNTIGGIAGQTVATRIENSYARTNFIATAAGNVKLGGLVGSVINRTGSGGIYSSYIMGALSHSCAANDTTCNMGSVIGITDASSNSSHYNTVAYPSGDYLPTTVFTYGSSQFDSSFLSSNPAWVRAGPVSIMGSFPSSIWNFSDSANPSLVGEPNP